MATDRNIDPSSATEAERTPKTAIRAAWASGDYHRFARAGPPKYRYEYLLVVARKGRA
jgi:hypothetical protein